jgi:hypothetical protein
MGPQLAGFLFSFHRKEVGNQKKGWEEMGNAPALPPLKRRLEAHGGLLRKSLGTPYA